MANKTLNDIPGDLAQDAQQAGLMRLHLYFVGQTHKRLNDLAARFRAILLQHATDAGDLDNLGYLFTQRDMLTAWQKFYREWTTLFESARWQAGSLAFGGLAVMQRRQSEVLQAADRQMSEVNARRRAQMLEDGAEPVLDAVYRPQLQAVLDAANRRLYGDGLTLSQRIWKWDQQSWTDIRATLAQGIAESESAWNIAKQLETALGAGAECPRWTSTRLGKLTKSDIAAGNRTGLYSGAACAGQGVAYNALRLARNEFQIAHHMATDTIFSKLPWITEEAINLSPSHPAINCACEDVVKSGKNGGNIYPKGEVSLPIHVQCLCYKTAVLLDDAEFVRRTRGWLNGTQPWGAMDDFSSWLGVPPLEAFSVSLAVGVANNLAVWLWGDAEALDDLMQGQPAQQLPLPEEL